MSFKFNFWKIGSKKNFEFLAGDIRAVVEFKTTRNSIFPKILVGFLSAKLSPIVQSNDPPFEKSEIVTRLKGNLRHLLAQILRETKG